MTTYIPTFEPGVVDTPAGMTTAVALGGFSGIPGSGTGLAGAVYAPGDPIRSLADLAAIIGAQEPDLTFTSTEVFYMARHSETSVAEFLRDDADSLSGDGTGIEMGPAGITLSGFIYIPPGTHAITVYADDGFALSLGGVEFAAADGVTHGESVTRVAEFDGGLYAVELAYYDAYSAMALGLAIDGLPVDQSAFYQSVEDFTDPPADVPLVPVTEYHPSYFLGEETLETPIDGNGTEGRDVIDGKGADDTLIGGGGDDELRGGYGNDQLLGGYGNDVLEGGRGSDLLDGGAGDDLLISRSDAGEQRIGQLAIGAPTRPDPDGEVDPDRQKLTAYLGQPLIGDDLLIGGEGRDTFLIAPQINAKADIIAQHIKDDGSIDWSGGGIAGENDEVHDHWVDSFGIDVIADYNAEEDTIAIIGHTATIHITYADVWGDEAEESIITVISNQGGGGGAHTQDLIGQLIVHGDRVELGDVQTDAGVTYGIVDDINGLPEALFPKGELKMTEVEGQTVYGYDTRDDQGNLGPVTANPAAYFDNPFFTEDMLVTPVHGDEAELTRGPFDQLGTIAVAGEDNTAPGAAKAATANDDMIAPDAAPAPEGLQGALAYWSLAGGADGVFDDARGGQELRAYTLFENQALLRTDGATAGRDGTEGTALYFDGKDDFAFINHDQTFEVSQGTIALWVRPDNLVGGKDIFLSKDNSGTVDGGHFRLGHAEDGRLYLRTAPGDGDSNKAWISNDVVFTEGEWAHVAVSNTAEGVTVYVNGVAIGADGWTAVEGDVPSPNEFTGYFMLNNEEPWVLGADTHRTERNDTAQEFGIDDEDLANAFEGAIQDVGIWGGMNAEDALNAAEIAELMANGPGAALTNPTGPAPMVAGDDVFAGGEGNDTIEGGAGDDHLMGDGGDDTLLGGYGNDLLEGGAGNDTLDGGRGSDKLEGGAGDDLLISRADSGEQRAGQLVLGEPSRPFPDPSISNEYLKLIDWVDQPIVGDDLMIGGEGADHFYFETVINAKMDIIMEHIQDDGRTINWAGVAGENNRIHDHWVDTLGIDIIADFDASEDSISVIGHTTQIEVSYKAIDTNGDGLNDDIVSIIHAYSQQGGGGGAHDEDSLGYIVVYGDLVEEGMVQTNAAVMYGIVETIDDLNEALAPTGETKTSIGPNGEALFGYDSRDVDGDPIGADPASYSSNSWFQNGDVELASAIPEGVDPPAIVMTDVGGTFDGSGADTKKIDHTTPMAQAEGTWAFSFTADDPNGATWQALLSKDHSDYKDGGHLTVYLSPAGQLKVRFQSETETRYLYGETVEAGLETHIAFTFENGVLKLYQNGELVADADGFPAGMLGNSEDIVLGASTETRVGANDNLRYFFTGTIGNLAVLDRPLTEYEAFFLSDAGGDLDALAALYDGDLPLVENPGDPGPNLLEGDEGNNSLHGYDDADLILGHGGDDHLYGYGDDDEMDGGAGNDRAFGGDGNDTMRGAAGDDSLYGDAGDDDLDGGEGNDHLRGGDGNDQITGGLGNDRSFGEDGNDVINGGEGDDSAYGGAGEDTILGGAGNDWMKGGDDNDTLSGGADDDTLYGEGGDDDLDGDDGNDRLSGGDGNDDLDGGAGDDRLYGDAGNDNLTGGGGNDAGYGGAGEDRLSGDLGNDMMKGGDDNDVVDGGAGEDRVYGDGGDDQVTGGAGNDYARGGAGADTVDGGDGDDRVYGDAGDDILTGGLGNDYLSGGDGNDQMDGGEGDDRMLGNAGEDVMTGGLGNDSLYGGDDNDQLDGGDGDDRLSGGDGDDTLKGEAGNDRMYGGDGDDDMEGGDGDDRLSGGDGNDRLVGGAGLNSLYGGLGADTLIGGAMADILRGGEGNDIITGEGGDDNIRGGAGDDEIDGVDGNDRISGEAGNDIIDGGEGNDTIYGGDDDDDLTGGLGNDYVSGGDGEDTVTGGLGDDRLRGGGDNDVLIGDDGNDDLRGGEGDDDLDAGEGDDRLYGDGGNDEMDGGDGADYMRGGDGNDMMSGGDGDDNMYGDAGNDTLVDGDGNDNLRSGSGDDDLNAGAGNDRLFANEGTNTMEGGTGNDLQYAGLGADTFVFREFGAANEDRIRYFDAGTDKIALDAAAFGVGPAFDAALFEFASAASTADTRFTYDQATGDLFYDADGNGAGAAERIAELDNGTALTIDDFVFV